MQHTCSSPLHKYDGSRRKYGEWGFRCNTHEKYEFLDFFFSFHVIWFNEKWNTCGVRVEKIIIKGVELWARCINRMNSCDKDFISMVWILTRFLCLQALVIRVWSGWMRSYLCIGGLNPRPSLWTSSPLNRFHVSSWADSFIL